MPKTVNRRLRVLVLGGDGMLGHQVLRRLSSKHAVRVTLRQDARFYRDAGLFNRQNAYFNVDARDFNAVEARTAAFRPHAIVNAIGIVKQRADAEDPVLNIEINALLPQRLAALCGRTGARLLHLSTDCVFNGSRGRYRESDVPDAEDIYGRSKLLGEVAEPHAITLRTSMIGPELHRKGGLLEWFLSQNGPVKGFTNAIFSGFTTLELARIIELVLVRHPAQRGVYHVSAPAIDKYRLLTLIKRYFKLDTPIIPDDGVRIDRSLDSRRFRRQFNYTPSSWHEMIGEMARDMGRRPQ